MVCSAKSRCKRHCNRNQVVDWPRLVRSSEAARLGSFYDRRQFEINRAMARRSLAERGAKQVKRTTKLTIETERVWVIRQGRVEHRGMCEACQEVVRLLTADEAARLARLGVRAIYRIVEAGKVHFTETVGGVLICLDSLGRSLRQTEAQKLTNHSHWEGENHES